MVSWKKYIHARERAVHERICHPLTPGMMCRDVPRDSLLLLFVEKYYTAAAQPPELVSFLNNITLIDRTLQCRC